MTTFAGLVGSANAKRPPGKLTLPVTVWASTYARKPAEEICVGLRFLSEADYAHARVVAARVAVDLHPGEIDADQVDAYNDALMRSVVASALCDPNDVTEPHFPAGDEHVRVALSSEGTKYVFDAVERFRVERSPTEPEITDEEIDDLPMLFMERIDVLPPLEARRLRRLLGHCYRTLEDVRARD